MKTALITGANKGIGFEAARILLKKGYFVYLGSRDLHNGEKAARILKEEGFSEFEIVTIDVSSEESVNTAKETIEQKNKKLDVLINNAGVNGGMIQNALDASVQAYKDVFEVNLYGAIRTTQALMDLLLESDQPRIVNVSSVLASLTLASNQEGELYDRKYVLYNSSKAVLNMYTIHLAYELKDTKFKVNTVCPGFTKTDFNNQQGTGTVEDAAEYIVHYALLNENGPTGKFFSKDMPLGNGEVPW